MGIWNLLFRKLRRINKYNEKILEKIINNQFGEGYISYNYIFNNKEIYITHFHPLMEELYKQLKEVNNGINILVVKKQFLDLMQGFFG